MPALDRRVQLLLDNDRYAALEREAQQSGRSVAAVIRVAIDEMLDHGAAGRRAAARRFLASRDPDDAPAVDWAVEKRAIEDEMLRGLDP
jgi:hypothetical protein